VSWREFSPDVDKHYRELDAEYTARVRTLAEEAGRIWDQEVMPILNAERRVWLYDALLGEKTHEFGESVRYVPVQISEGKMANPAHRSLRRCFESLKGGLSPVR
jgi:hypothetical protein